MKRILIADSDAPARKMLARVLESCGYVAVEASNERDALSKFRAQTPTLAILDFKGEQQDGWNLYEEIRRLEPMVPVIGITAWSNQYADAMRRGVDALMEKPLDLKALLKMIEQLVVDSQSDVPGHARNHKDNLPSNSQKPGLRGISA